MVLCPVKEVQKGRWLRWKKKSGLGGFLEKNVYVGQSGQTLTEVFFPTIRQLRACFYLYMSQCLMVRGSTQKNMLQKFSDLALFRSNFLCCCEFKKNASEKKQGLKYLKGREKNGGSFFLFFATLKFANFDATKLLTWAPQS